MDYVESLLNFMLNLDSYLISFVATHGVWTYVFVFTVIFCETGLIVMGFLPGDSLLFTLGSLSALSENPLNILVLLPMLILASILGNQLNYSMGRAIGPKIFSVNRPWLVNQKYLEEAHQFYEKHGGKTIIFARFMPVIRSFVPFIAGVSYMSVNRFHYYNISSAVLWISSLLGMGYFFGSQPIIKNNFSMVIYGIIVVSFLPPLFALIYQRLIKPKFG